MHKKPWNVITALVRHSKYDLIDTSGEMQGLYESDSIDRKSRQSIEYPKKHNDKEDGRNVQGRSHLGWLSQSGEFIDGIFGST